MNSFKCIHCHKIVSNKAIGTENRNHCNFCLWSRHVDIKRGDRKSKCRGTMEPIGLAFKSDTSELMLIEKCIICGKFSINRIAGDDEKAEIMKIFNASKNLSDFMKNWLKDDGIMLADKADEKEIKTQLFGKIN